jgi:hypothetical protein
MNSYNQWKTQKRFHELYSNAFGQPDAAQNAQPDMPPSPAPMQSSPMQQANNTENPYDALSGQTAQHLRRATQSLAQKPVNVILQAQQAFNAQVQQLLQAKSDSAARRGARLNLNQARSAFRNPTM